MKEALLSLCLQEKNLNFIDVHFENPKIKKFTILLGNKLQFAPYEE